MTERNHADFALKSILTAAKPAQALAALALSTKPKEPQS